MIDAVKAAQPFHPLIVNGSMSSSYPSTGALLVFADAQASTLYGLCSGTLIGCHTFLTAAHCVCPEETSDASGCLRAGLTDPSLIRVFLQHGGLFRATAVAIAPDYSFAERGDLAVITLADEVTGIRPSPINTTSKPSPGRAAAIVGFGTTEGGFMSVNDAGIKRQGELIIDSCGEDIADATNICWQFSGSGANVCSGDSGGPLFVDFGSGPTVAGVTSGSYSFDCEPPDMSFDSDVFGYRAWIEATAGVALADESCVLAAVGDASTHTITTAGQLSASNRQADLQFEVPAGTALLRVALNGQLAGSAGFSATSNDYDLYLRAFDPPTTGSFDCADTNSTTFGFCEIEAPAAGTWHAMVRLGQGSGTYQVTVTSFATAAQNDCAGDCNRDGAVTADDLRLAVEVALERAPASACNPIDADGDGQVSIDELIAATRFGLGECPVS